MPELPLSHAAGWKQKLYGYLALARLSNSPTVVSNVLAGAALAGVLVPDTIVLVVALAMVCFYTAGMYLNDLFDYEIDARERPERPLPSGLISRRAATLVTVILFAAGSLLLAFVGWVPFLSGLVLIALIVVYDAWHKTNPASPLLMALTRVMVYVTAFASFSTVVELPFLFASGLLLLYVVGLTYVAKSETKEAFTRFWPVVLLLLPVPYFAVQVPWGAWSLLVIAFAGWVVYSVRFVYRGRIGAGIARLIAGMALFDALVLASRLAPLGVLLALSAFGLTLFLQRYIQGT